MIIRITRSGGFAGVSEELSRLDTKTLSRDRQQQIHTQVNRLLSLEGEAQERALGADLIAYRVEVEDPTGRRKEIAVVDDQDPGNRPLQILTELLQAAGHPARGPV